jgi:large subunit ribosomal protein L9
MAKIILTHEVTGLGAAGDIVEVKNGYARNYLLPRKLATPWTKGAASQIEAMARARRARALASVEDAQAARDTLAEAVITVAEKAGESGRLFGTVTTANIADAIKAQTKLAVDKRKIELGEHIKNVGEYQVKIRLHDEIQVPVTIKVEAAK